jgi:hypothetical protein
MLVALAVRVNRNSDVLLAPKGLASGMSGE